jgi:ribosomal protein L16 Arg81 hydroxylase
MKQKLHKDLQALLEFYRKQIQDPPAEFSHATGVINKPEFFTLADLQRHLNNPLLRPEWAHVKLGGKRVELEKSCFTKTVQGRKLDFMDKQALNDAIDQGAAVVLEGIDILDPAINDFVARLDESLPCVLANSVVFLSQAKNEAYDGHCDADDVLVVQLEGKKTWQLFKPQQRRYLGITDQNEQQLGPVEHELVMRPGDALYVRAGVPHRCRTSSAYSLHMSFDLVDQTPTTADIAAQANNLYNHACELPYSPASSIIERYVSILKMSDFQQALAEATEIKRADISRFREMLGRSSAVKSLNKLK